MTKNPDDTQTPVGRVPVYEDDKLDFLADDMVKSCTKLESGLRLGDDGIRACCMGAIVSPLFWSPEELSESVPTKEMIMQRRKMLFKALNDPTSGDISCKSCDMVCTKPFKEVSFDKLGHVNLAHYSMCNLRCSFCGFTQYNIFVPPQYDALAVLQNFDKSDVEWDSFVDLNGGEPTLLKDLDLYLDYFQSRGIRILLYTNAVRYSQKIYDALKDGTITWLITSLDAGTPATFKKIKGRDKFEMTMENLTRYAKAGSEGLGNLAVKYIFCADNCSDDDVLGFAYAMLAIRPQKVWLTFDFFPLADTYEGQDEAGDYDFSEHVRAYIKLYILLKKHGLEPAHFAKTHLALIMQAGKDLIQAVEEGIQEAESRMELNDQDLQLTDFRTGEETNDFSTRHFDLTPLRLKMDDGSWESWDLSSKSVLLAPAYGRTATLLEDLQISKSNILGFVDRNPVLHGKNIKGLPIYGYDALADLDPDVVLVAGPQQHQNDIIRSLTQNLTIQTTVAAMNGES